VVDTGTPEELEPNDRLLQKRAKTESEQEKVLNKTKTNKNSPTRNEGHIIVLIFLSLQQDSYSAI